MPIIIEKSLFFINTQMYSKFIFLQILSPQVINIFVKNLGSSKQDGVLVIL